MSDTTPCEQSQSQSVQQFSFGKQRQAPSQESDRGYAAETDTECDTQQSSATYASWAFDVADSRLAGKALSKDQLSTISVSRHSQPHQKAVKFESVTKPKLIASQQVSDAKASEEMLASLKSKNTPVVLMEREETAGRESVSTNFYSTQDSEASALFVTQINHLIEKGDRHRQLAGYKQFGVLGEDPNLLPPTSRQTTLQVMVRASDRLRSDHFRGVIDPSKRVRRGKQHLKFPLFRDEHIGIESKLTAHGLINQTADEDYETDGEILRRTINTCKRDCLVALRQVQDKPFSFQETLHNHKYQKRFGQAAVPKPQPKTK